MTPVKTASNQDLTLNKLIVMEKIDLFTQVYMMEVQFQNYTGSYHFH